MPYPPECEQDYINTNSAVLVIVTNIVGSGYLHRISLKAVTTAGEIKIDIDGNIQTMAVPTGYRTVKPDHDSSIPDFFQIIDTDISDFINVWFKNNLKIEIRNVNNNVIASKVLYALL